MVITPCSRQPPDEAQPTLKGETLDVITEQIQVAQAFLRAGEITTSGQHTEQCVEQGGRALVGRVAWVLGPRAAAGGAIAADLTSARWAS
jgi:hypothetical protein